MRLANRRQVTSPDRRRVEASKEAAHMRVKFNEGYSLDIFRDPDGGKGWIMYLDHEEDEDADLDPCEWLHASAEAALYEFVKYVSDRIMRADWWHVVPSKVLDRVNRFAAKHNLTPIHLG
jgi:hypothetical protein